MVSLYQAVSSVNSLLEKADRLYKQLQLNRPALEALLIKVNEHSYDKAQEEVTTVSSGSGGSNNANNANASNVNRSIQQLAQRYCGDCKATFDELSKIIQRVLASRKELVEYDRHQREAALAAALPGSTPTTPTTRVSPRGTPAPPLFPRVKEVASCELRRKDKWVAWREHG